MAMNSLLLASSGLLRQLPKISIADASTIDHRSQEQTPTTAPYGSTQPSVEDYLADTVCRLYALACRWVAGMDFRSGDVTGRQAWRLGEHAWWLVSHENV
jgi:hypothetical protein